jgi:Homeobox KN domain
MDISTLLEGYYSSNYIDEQGSKCQRPKVRTRGRESSKRHPVEAVEVLQKWLDAHSIREYPTREEKQELARKSGLTIKQCDIWFRNARNRHTSPLEQYLSDGAEAASLNDIQKAASNLLEFDGPVWHPGECGATLHDKTFIDVYFQSQSITASNV